MPRSIIGQKGKGSCRSPSECIVPELPEVETVVRDLRPRLVGRRIASVEVSTLPLRRRWLSEWDQALKGRRVRQLGRRGKWITFGLHDDSHLVFHLGMTGQLRIVPSTELRLPHTHMIFRLDRGREELRFGDIRRFGCATFFPTPGVMDEFFASTGLGPEPFELDAAYLRERLAGTKRCLKAILLDQRVLAGVGNIYADESLFQARLHPAQLGCETTGEQASRLRRAIVTVLQRAINRHGSSIRNYVGGLGAKGQYQEEFRVYSRTGKPCPRCRQPIALIRLAGRATHFCPHCQPLR